MLRPPGRKRSYTFSFHFGGPEESFRSFLRPAAQAGFLFALTALGGSGWLLFTLTASGGSDRNCPFFRSRNVIK